VKMGQSGINIKIAKPETKRIEILKEEEVQQLFEACDCTMLGIRDKLIISLAYGAGLRKQELLNLKINDIDLNKGRIHIDKSKTKYGRDVPITKKVQENIENYLFNVRNMMLDDGNDLTSLLITKRGTAMSGSGLVGVIKRLNNKSTIDRKINLHLFRHSIATHLIRYLKLEDVATFLGHRSLDSTMRYLHLKQEYYG